MTHTRDPRLLAAADLAESIGHDVAAVLRRSRLEVWTESDSSYEDDVQAGILDATIAQQYASPHARTAAGITVDAEPGSYETLAENADVVLSALRTHIPDL